MRFRSLAVLGTVAITTTAAAALPVAGTEPVKCSESDVTPDGRVFPEPILTETFIRFPEFECGIELLDSVFPDFIDIDVLDESSSGLPIYDVVMTDEQLPEDDKQHLLVINSIHGNEPAGREGAFRVIEDMVDPWRLGNEDWVRELLDRFVVHFVFANPDGWVNGDVHGDHGAGNIMTRRNDGNRDLNRNFPVQGYLRASNGTLDQPEGRALDALLLEHAVPNADSDAAGYDGWYLGTDNHGQGPKTVAASGLQIVGEFDFEKSERLAHFADGIEPAMAEYGVLDVIEQLNQVTDGAVRPYEWGTLYDILGYSASGSGIDYYNTPGVVNGTGFATEMTASNAPYNALTHPGLVNQMWVNSVRAINYTMFKDALDPPSYTYPVGGAAAYVFDPERVRHDDANGFGPGNESIPGDFTGDDANVDPDFQLRRYDVSRMKFFEDLNRYADQPLDAIRVPDVLSGEVDLSTYDSVVLTEDAMPEAGDHSAWVTALRSFAAGGGNLVVTDAAAPILADLFDDIEPGDISMQRRNVGYVDFGDRSHHLNEGLRGVASQTYDVIPIGYPDNNGQAPNWRVATAAWDANAGYTAGTNGNGQTIYGEKPLGDGKVSFLGALLPQPTEDYFHPYGLQNYAVTYTGYTLLENMLDHTR
ncbi:MAG: hypothetical protein KY469_12295 [Actinobacteria bacterium]|nr:hypothetical protein [Actinomycetota bacterium]